MSRLQTEAALTAIEADVKLRVARLTLCPAMHAHVTSHTLLNSLIFFTKFSFNYCEI